MSLWDLVLTQGQGESFDDMTLKRLEKQEEQFNKPNYSLLSFIPLAIIAYLVLKK